MRKPDFCLCENKDADQLRSNCEADQRLCFRYSDNIPFLLISEISSFLPSSETVQIGLCQTWSETPKTVFSRRDSITVNYYGHVKSSVHFFAVRSKSVLI